MTIYELYGRMDTSELSADLNRPGIILYLYAYTLHTPKYVYV